MLICFNGEFVTPEQARVSLQDGSVLFGDSLFETMKANQQSVAFAKEHLDRLQQAAWLSGFPCDRPQLDAALEQVSKRLQAPCSRLRLTLGRGEFAGLDFPEQQGWFCLTACDYPSLPEETWPAGLSAVIAPNRRVNPLSHLPQLKRGNYADCLYAKNYAHSQQADEAIFVDEKGLVLEGATSNIFIRKERTLITPPCGQLVLNGIIRQQLLTLGTMLDLEVVERDLSLTELQNADETFITNSLIDIRPLLSLDGQPLPQGDSWKMLFILLRQTIQG